MPPKWRGRGGVLPPGNWRMSASVQTKDFDLSTEVDSLRQRPHRYRRGVQFYRMRPRWAADPESYPAMALKSLEAIEGKATERFGLLSLSSYPSFRCADGGGPNRSGVTAARHRQAAFDGAAFIMDHIKSRAPFWKLENGQWVEARQSDTAALQAWDKGLKKIYDR